MEISLIIPTFVAGLLTFLAPCTLPLVPGFLAFISGVSPAELEKGDVFDTAHRRVLLNGVLYVLGFSVVFILLGSLFGLGASFLIEYQILMQRLGGIIVILFGLYMLGVLNMQLFTFLDTEKKIHASHLIHPGKPFSSFLFGSTFALGWSPCIGPILGSVLLLASTSATVVQGAFLLAIFSFGLGLPFIIMAATIGHAMKALKQLQTYLGVISKIAGVFLLILGMMLLTDTLYVWNGLFDGLFTTVGYENFIDFL